MQLLDLHTEWVEGGRTPAHLGDNCGGRLTQLNSLDVALNKDTRRREEQREIPPLNHSPRTVTANAVCAKLNRKSPG